MKPIDEELRLTRLCNFAIWLDLVYSKGMSHVQKALYFEINWNNFQRSYFSEYPQLLHPEAVVPRCSAKMLFHRKTSMAEFHCNCWSESSNLLRQDSFTCVFPWTYTITYANSCFCTSSNKITTFYKKFSALFPRHFVPYLSFLSLSFFCHKLEFFIIFMQILCAISCKHKY